MLKGDRILIQKIEDLQQAYVVLATSDEGDASCFDELRPELLALDSVADLLPEFVHRYRTREQFWHFIKRRYPTYAERREFIWQSFHAALAYAEGKDATPSDSLVREGLASLDSAHIHDIWAKALKRRSEDPEGAITAARTLLESTCKLILDESGETYTDSAELPKLYAQTAKRLNLAPSQHTEQIFKQILGGCQTVVEGVGAIRNRLSDAHGRGKKPIKPAARHAELVVNLAGAMAVFLAASWANLRDSAV